MQKYSTQSSRTVWKKNVDVYLQRLISQKSSLLLDFDVYCICVGLTLKTPGVVTSYSQNVTTLYNSLPTFEAARRLIKSGEWQWQRKVVKTGAITSSRMKLSGNVGHAIIFSWMLTTACCLVETALRLGLNLVSDCTRIYTTFLVIVSLAIKSRRLVSRRL